LLIVAQKCTANPNPLPNEEIAFTFLKMTCTDLFPKMHTFLSNTTVENINEYWQKWKKLPTPRLNELRRNLLEQYRSREKKTR